MAEPGEEIADDQRRQWVVRSQQRARPTGPTSAPEQGQPTQVAVSYHLSLLTRKCRIPGRKFAVRFAFEALMMNDSPRRWRSIAAFTILASALSCTLAGCTSKTSPPPAAQTPSATPGANPANAASTAPASPANAANPASVASAPAPGPQPAPQPALVSSPRHPVASASESDH